jgi:hypothetical protein
MKRSKLKPKSAPKRVLRLPDLDHTKLSVLNTLGSPQSQRAYGIAIDDFIAWYCSEPRIAFNKTVVLRYRIQLEAKHLAPATINLRLAAVRRLAYEAADVGLLSPDLAAGIRRVKGAKRLGVRRLCITPEDACARDIRSQWRRMTLSLVATPIDPDVPTAERSPIGIIGLLRAIVSDLRTPAENPVAGDFRLRIWLPRQDISSSQRNWHSS